MSMREYIRIVAYKHREKYKSKNKYRCIHSARTLTHHGIAGSASISASTGNSARPGVRVSVSIGVSVSLSTSQKYKYESTLRAHLDDVVREPGVRV